MTVQYVSCTGSVFVGPQMELIDIVQEKLTEWGLEVIENPHVSLTKTVVLQYHWIQRFINDIKCQLQAIQRFYFSNIFF